MKIGRKHILIEQCTIEEMQQKLSEFPKRYHNFQMPKQESIWSFRIVSMDNKYYVIQLIDKNFEPPRGKVSSDQPYIYIHTLQDGEHVKLVYWLRWQKWKFALIWFGVLFYSSIWLTTICISTLGGKHSFFAVGLWLLGLCFFIVWLAQNIRHDRLAMKIFEELLQRNFPTIHFIREIVT